ncbi:carbohydrate ABC transporter permease [uncultured Bifidobacterium sp.]|uniref:carbohydrate ABC transporter permease n=1 Tax=uncultured Bifidobacterium sp. TaxID=165187 RepID=UPI002616F39E|nr:sugar ABC transporter permease [uncultured Bifidobacterium sp.]
MTTATTAASPRARKHRKASEGLEPSPYSAATALRNGDLITRLSLIVFGLGNIVRKQFVKGLILLALEAGIIAYFFGFLSPYLSKLHTLGTVAQTKVQDADGFWTYKAGDNSVQILLYGVMALFVIVLFVLTAVASLKSAYKAQTALQDGERPTTFREDLHALTDSRANVALMFLPTLGIVLFTILPLAFMISMAFTSYDKNHVVLFSWVGLKNFGTVFGNSGDVNAPLFLSVLIWTLVWAFFATFLNFFLGMFMAMIINRKTTHGKAFWRACFSMSIAVPQFVSLLVMRTMLQPTGAINRLLLNAGIINQGLPWLTDTTWARVTVIVINLWIGIPYTIMQITGILQNVPADLYEAAELDGANWWQRFANVTMPYIIFVMTPYLITTFTANVNNFNVIYLLSGGDPTPVGASAGKTDLLITWLYKLTVDKSNYNLGAVIGIMTFIVLAVLSLITYRHSGSYKNEEGFR